MRRSWQDCLITIGLVISLWPVVAVVGVISIHREIKSRRAYNRTHPSPPRPLPRKRRALSTTPFSRTVNSNCPLLTRLPPEIRLEIYRYVLGDNILHLVQGVKRISHVRCRATTETDYVRSCRPLAANTAGRLLPGSTSNGNLALVKTCRQIYRESMHILYATNAFDLDYPTTLFYFAESIRPQHLACITKLHVYLPIVAQLWFSHIDDYPGRTPPYDYTSWMRFWHIIAIQMPRLADLRLCLGVRMGGEHMEVTQGWIQPLLQIRGLRRFEFDVRYMDDPKADTASLNVAQVRQYLRERLLPQRQENI